MILISWNLIESQACLTRVEIVRGSAAEGREVERVFFEGACFSNDLLLTSGGMISALQSKFSTVEQDIHAECCWLFKLIDAREQAQFW